MDLISKKELLSVTGISYGQLYRWKREKLIPEEWFIKQSSYTGQETFFPKEQILGRIKAILEAKGEHSLEELAQMFSPEHTASHLPQANLERIAELDENARRVIAADWPKEAYSFWDVVLMLVVARARAALSMDDAQAGSLLKKAASVSGLLSSTDMTCTVFSCAGEYHLAFARDVMPVLFDETIQARAVYAIAETADRVKMEYAALFTTEV